MKVGTDGVLIGAWTTCLNKKNILDIGTGTGLIAIMMAQQTEALIDAVELDRDSFLQALENVAICKWNNRINLYNLSIQDYVKNFHKQYDLIVSNPPFFNNSLKAEKATKNISKHNDQLSYADLISATLEVLSDDGTFSVILPYVEGMQFIEMCSRSLLFCIRKTVVYPCPWKNPARLLLEFSKIETTILEKSLTIELNERHQYSDDYKNLTKEFYL